MFIVYFTGPFILVQESWSSKIHTVPQRCTCHTVTPSDPCACTVHVRLAPSTISVFFCCCTSHQPTICMLIQLAYSLILLFHFFERKPDPTCPSYACMTDHTSTRTIRRIFYSGTHKKTLWQKQRQRRCSAPNDDTLFFSSFFFSHDDEKRRLSYCWS